MEITIREARAEDAAPLIEYVQRLVAEPGVDILIGPGEFTLTVEQERAILVEFAAADNSIYLVAEAEGAIVGILNCKGGVRRAVRYAVSLGMSVAKEWCNRGVGQLLMERAIEWAQANPVVRRIELFVFARNAAAIHLYEKFGFVLEGRRRGSIHRDGEDHNDLMMALLV